jgi:hypothetical protein
MASDAAYQRSSGDIIENEKPVPLTHTTTAVSMSPELFEKVRAQHLNRILELVH